MKDQVKAARAADFDQKVQSGLGDIEPEPEAAEIKTAVPPAPTAAKVAPPLREGQIGFRT